MAALCKLLPERRVRAQAHVDRDIHLRWHGCADRSSNFQRGRVGALGDVRRRFCQWLPEGKLFFRT